MRGRTRMGQTGGEIHQNRFGIAIGIEIEKQGSIPIPIAIPIPIPTYASVSNSPQSLPFTRHSQSCVERAGSVKAGSGFYCPGTIKAGLKKRLLLYGIRLRRSRGLFGFFNLSALAGREGFFLLDQLFFRKFP